jgi:hypothetical protein
MDERSFMIARIDALAEKLNLAEAALDAEQISPKLRDKVKIRFGLKVDKQKKKLEELRKNVDNGMQLEICATSFRNISEVCDPLFREVLAFVEGALVRSAGLDNGMCYLADALLDDLSHNTDIPWVRLTIMGEEEFFSQMAEIIRLRFPEFSIWNLPILGHEFGHLVGQELKTLDSVGMYQSLFKSLQGELNVRLEEIPYLREYFADIFAVYVLGPAFACTCIILRFDPMMANIDTEEHPSYAKRAYMILEALKKMDEAEGGVIRPYNQIIKSLDETWYKTGRVKRLDGPTTIELNDWLKGIYGLIDAELSRSKYNGWLGAQRLAKELCRENFQSPILKEEIMIADVFNAAWLCRMQQEGKDGYPVHQISQKAIKLCQQIIKARN